MNLNIVYEKILKENKISKSDILNIINETSYYECDYADIYFQDSCSEYLCLENNKIKHNFLNYNKGVSLRLNKYDKTFFSYTNEINKNSLFNLIKKFNCFYNKNIFVNKNKLIILKNKIINNVSFPIDFSLNKKKINFLFYLYNNIKKIDSRINYVLISLFSKYDLILLSNTDFILAADIRPLLNLSIKVQVENKSCKEIGISGGGGRYSFNEILSINYNNIPIFDHWSNEAVRIAINNLYASNAPAGNMPVVLSNGSPGILLHEAIGHGLEGDFNRNHTSLFYKYLNKKIAPNNFTIIDDNTLYRKRGSSSIDDEGILSQRRILIENGILKSYLLDRLNARLMNTKSNGSGRRESYSFLPIPRMSNTYLLPGKYSVNDIINSVDYGLYIVNLSGGQVDITSGNFVFTILEGYLIKKGKISNPIKGLTLIGSSIDIINKISMIANDLKFDSGMGLCGKDNQNIPVSVGQPTLKIDFITVGGLN